MADPFIPKVLHFTSSYSWGNLPRLQQNCLDSWVRLNPSYDLKFYTDLDNFNLVNEFYNHLLPLYFRFPYNTQRADLAKYLYLHRYGGVYVDTDLECIKPIDNLVSSEDKDLFVLESFPNAYHENFLIATYLMASEPKGSLVSAVVNEVRREPPILLPPRDNMRYLVCCTTGPLMVTRAYRNLVGTNNKFKANIKDSLHFSPYSVQELERSRETGANYVALPNVDLKNSYGIHHFQGTWW